LRDHPRARVVTMLGYEGLPELDGRCDVVVSLSVLEHVKDLRRFLRFSAGKARPDGRIVHLYDLGHALYPGSVRERLRVAASTWRLTRPFVPETRFAAYVDRRSAEAWLREAGVAVERVTYHNMPGHVRLLKTLRPSPDGERLLDEIAELEVCAAAQLADAGPAALEALFPSACLWGRRVGAGDGAP
jgi:hypothetical protein